MCKHLIHMLDLNNKNLSIWREGGEKSSTHPPKKFSCDWKFAAQHEKYLMYFHSVYYFQILSDELKEKIERNRRLALERRAQKLQNSGLCQLFHSIKSHFIVSFDRSWQ